MHVGTDEYRNNDKNAWCRLKYGNDCLVLEYSMIERNFREQDDMGRLELEHPVFIGFGFGPRELLSPEMLAVGQRTKAWHKIDSQSLGEELLERNPVLLGPGASDSRIDIVDPRQCQSYHLDSHARPKTYLEVPRATSLRLSLSSIWTLKVAILSSIFVIASRSFSSVAIRFSS